MTTMKRVSGPGSDRFKRTLQEMDNANVRVGWFESSKYPDEKQTPVAYVAAINELGPHARPFFRTTAEEQDKDWAELMFMFCKQVVKGNWTVEQALEAIGLRAGADVQKKIAEIAKGGGLSLITLVARKYKQEGKKVTGGTIGEIAAAIKKDPDGMRAYAADIRDTPLNETGYMIATVAASVNEKDPIYVNENPT